MQQPIDSTHLQYFDGLLIVAIAGSLGGLVSAIGALVETGVDQNGQFPITKGVSVALFLFGRCVVGVGGAAAVLLAALTVDKFTRETDHLALTVLCFVAGSIGYRLLPMVAAQIEKRLGDVEKKAARAEKTAKDGVNSASVTSNVLSALQVLRDPEEMTSFVDDTVSHLEKVAREFPQDRSLHIVLARLYVEKKHDLKAGIETLRRFVKNKGKKKDEHVADALFNIACYYSLELAKESDAPKIKFLTEQGYKALEAAFAIKPGIVADAKTDPDLEALRATHALAPLFSRTGDKN